MIILIASLALGSCAGVYARTRNWLGEDLASEVHRWAKTGYPEQTIYRRLFDRQVLSEPRGSATESKNSAHSPEPLSLVSKGVLFLAIAPERCQELRSIPDQRLPGQLSLLDDQRVTRFAAGVDNPAILRRFVKEVLCPLESH